MQLTSLRAFSAAPSGPTPPALPRRHAIVGAGFAGVALAWHLLSRSSPDAPIHIDLYDSFGLGAGGSGAAAGLLHPYTPRGKVLWRGVEAFQDALRLVGAAEAAVDASTTPPFVWRHGLLRPARSAKQASDFKKHVPQDAAAAEVAGGRCIDPTEMESLVPGLQPNGLLDSGDRDSGGSLCTSAGLLASQGLVVRPTAYLAALWQACTQMQQASQAKLIVQAVGSLDQLQAENGPYDAICVATGAAIDSIQQTQGLFSLDLCQGYTLDMQRGNQGATFPHSAPSLLGSPYIAMHGASRAVVGATQRHGASPGEAYASLGPGGIVPPSSSAWTEAEHVLKPAAAHLWRPLEDWEVIGVKSGVRAIPTRTQHGSVPYAGRLPEGVTGGENWWLVCGLGARGLVYHAWLGRLVAAAIVEGSESGLPKEVLRWKKDPLPV